MINKYDIISYLFVRLISLKFQIKGDSFMEFMNEKNNYIEDLDLQNEIDLCCEDCNKENCRIAGYFKSELIKCNKLNSLYNCYRDRKEN